MSEYVKKKTTYTSRVHLRTALQAAGIQFEEAQPGQTLTLNGYGNQRRQATFAVRQRALGDNIFGDLGWLWDGQAKCFVQIADHLDERYSQTVRALRAIKREYAYTATVSQARTKGYHTQRVDQPDGSIQIRITGRI